MTLKWITQPIVLKYRFGEFTLRAVRFNALMPDVHFSKLPSDVTEPPELAEQLAAADVVFFQSHPVTSKPRRILTSPNAIRYVPLQYNHYYVDLHGSFTGYLDKFSSKTRSTLKRKIKKAAELSGGTIEWRVYQRPEEMEEFHKLAREVAAKTYQERLLHVGIPSNAAFIAQMKELALADRVRAYLLFDKSKPIAYLYCPVTDGILSYDFLGYDPEYSAWSAGTVLQYLALERLFGEQIHSTFDFTEGGGPHKELFATHCVPCADVYYFRRTLRNRTFVCVHATLVSLSKAVTRTVDFLGLKKWIKKIIRSRA